MKTELNEVLEVVPKRLDHQVENEVGVIHEEDNGKKKKSKDEAYLTDSSYAILDASENRHRGHCCDTPDDHDLDLDIITRNVVIEDVKSLIDLNSAKAQAGADSKQSCDDGNRVYQVSGPAEYLVSYKRVEAGLDGEG